MTGMAFDPRLGALFVFSAEDLAANRRGDLSDDQRVQVAGGVRGTRRSLTRGRIVIGVAVVAAAVVVAMMTRSQGGGSLPLILSGAALAVMFGAVRIAQRRWSRSVDRVETATLRTAEGPFDWTTSPGGFWIGRVGPARFSVDRAHLEVLDHGGTFRVHYLPWRDDFAWVMSIERIGGA